MLLLCAGYLTDIRTFHWKFHKTSIILKLKRRELRQSRDSPRSHILLIRNCYLTINLNIIKINFTHILKYLKVGSLWFVRSLRYVIIDPFMLFSLHVLPTYVLDLLSSFPEMAVGVMEITLIFHSRSGRNYGENRISSLKLRVPPRMDFSWTTSPHLLPFNLTHRNNNSLLSAVGPS